MRHQKRLGSLHLHAQLVEPRDILRGRRSAFHVAILELTQYVKFHAQLTLHLCSHDGILFGAGRARFKHRRRSRFWSRCPHPERPNPLECSWYLICSLARRRSRFECRGQRLLH